MADSIRKQVIDAFIAVLTTGTTGIVTITGKKEEWWNWNPDKFPAVCVLEGTERRDRAYFSGGSTSLNDMQSEMEVNVLGYVFDQTNNLTTKRTDLIKDIERAIHASTTLNDLTLDVVVETVETDEGTLDNFAATHSKYMVKYIYNHASP